MAKTGSPGEVNGVSWPLFDGDGQGGSVMNLAAKAAPMQGWPHAADCAVWKATVGSLL
jgi:hypothetical protein